MSSINYTEEQPLYNDLKIISPVKHQNKNKSNNNTNELTYNIKRQLSTIKHDGNNQLEKASSNDLQNLINVNHSKPNIPVYRNNNFVYSSSRINEVNSKYLKSNLNKLQIPNQATTISNNSINSQSRNQSIIFGGINDTKTHKGKLRFSKSRILDSSVISAKSFGINESNINKSFHFPKNTEIKSTNEYNNYLRLLNDNLDDMIHKIQGKIDNKHPTTTDNKEFKSENLEKLISIAEVKLKNTMKDHEKYYTLYNQIKHNKLIDYLKKEIIEHDESISELKQSIKDKNHKIIQLDKDISRLEKKFDQLEEEETNETKETQHLKIKMKYFNDKIESMSKEITILIANLDVKKDKIIRVNKENINITKETSNVDDDISNKIFNNLDNTIKSLDDKIKQELENEKRLKKVEKHSKEIQTLERQINSLQIETKDTFIKKQNILGKQSVKNILKEYKDGNNKKELNS